MTGRESDRDRQPEAATDDPVPLSGLADAVAERREGSGDDLFEATFAEQSFEDLSEGSVWEDVDDAGGFEFGTIGEVIEEDEETFVVAKRNFCERCRYFSSPPAVSCTHDGTDIVEFVDKDHVRVRSCPIVEERGVANDGSRG